MKMILGGLALLLLSACSTLYPPAGMTQQQIAKDQYECDRDSSMAASGYAMVSPMGAAAREARLYKSCLEVRGWSEDSYLDKMANKAEN